MPVPHLSTALSGPILDLESRIIGAMPDIEHWLRRKWRNHAVPFIAQSICVIVDSNWHRSIPIYFRADLII